MKILLTNDDGISSKGLYSLAQKLSKTNEVYVFAPSSQKSACSQSLTVHSSFRLMR
jgi:Predicted acid phosphatase